MKRLEDHTLVGIEFGEKELILSARQLNLGKVSRGKTRIPNPVSPKNGKEISQGCLGFAIETA
jgi:hypothetical protein